MADRTGGGIQAVNVSDGAILLHPPLTSRCAAWFQQATDTTSLWPRGWGPLVENIMHQKLLVIISGCWFTGAFYFCLSIF